jgi:hypothetical protein
VKPSASFQLLSISVFYSLLWLLQFRLSENIL